MLACTIERGAEAILETSGKRAYWMLRAAILLCLTPLPSYAQKRLPELCYLVSADSLMDGSASRTNEPRVAAIADSLRKAIPSSPEGIEGASIWPIRRVLDPLALADSVEFQWALASLIVDNRTTTTFAAVVAAQYFSAYGGSAEQLLTAFHEAAEPPDRLLWVLLALEPPLTRRAERDLFRYGCVAAWALAQLESDPFLKWLAEQGRAPVTRLELAAVLAEVERLTSGSIREQAESLRAFVNQR